MKRGLQIVLAALSLIPLYFAVTGVLGGAASINDGTATSANLDNQFRYLSAFYMSLFFFIWWVIPQIEKQTSIFRLVILALFLGGLARLVSYMTVGVPTPDMLVGMALELGSPLLALWQAKIAKTA